MLCCKMRSCLRSEDTSVRSERMLEESCCATILLYDNEEIVLH